MDVMYFELYGHVDDGGDSLLALLEALWTNGSHRYAMYWTCHKDFERPGIAVLYKFVRFLVGKRAINQQRLIGTVVVLHETDSIILDFVKVVLASSPSQRPLHFIKASQTSPTPAAVFADLLKSEE